MIQASRHPSALGFALNRKNFRLISNRQLILGSTFGVVLGVMLIMTRNLDFLAPFVFFFIVIMTEISAPFVRGFRYSRMIRYPLFLVPYFLPLFSFGIPATGHEDLLLGLALGIALGGCLVFVQFKKIKLLLSDEAIELLVPDSVQILPLIVFVTFNIFSSIGQEIFYRAYMLPALTSYISIYSILVTAFLFSFEHYLNRWATVTYENRDYPILFLVGCAFGLLYFFTKSIAGCVLAHTIYNGPNIIRQYKIYKKGKKRHQAPNRTYGTLAA